MRNLLLCLTLCCAAFLPHAASAAGTLSVEAPYVRLVPPNAPASAAFMSIANSGNTDRQLVKAESPAARIVELHTHINEGGVMKMRPVPNIEIRAQSRTELKPGGLHIMLIDLKQALTTDTTVPLTLTFDDGSTLSLDAPVQKVHMAPATQSAGEHAPMKMH